MAAGTRWMVVLAPLVHVLAVEEEVRDAVREREGRHHDAVHHEELVLGHGRVDAAGLHVLGRLGNLVLAVFGHHAVAFLEGARRDEAVVAGGDEVVAGHAHALAVDGDDLVEVVRPLVVRVGLEDDLRVGDGAVAVRACDDIADLGSK